MADRFANRYELYEQLGRGGMGVVFRAVDRLTGQVVALKRVTMLAETTAENSYSSTKAFRLALAREFKTLASLRHPHIIAVLDYGFDDDKLPYFTMEYVSDSLTFTQAGSSRNSEQKIDLLVHLLQALAYLHRRGVLHRDLKPANVLVMSEGTLKVLDFGLAAQPEELEDDDTIAGTLNYMAPEVLRGLPASRASDLYAVGVMAYELLTGRHPFQGAQQRADLLIQTILQEEPDLTPVVDWELTSQINRTQTGPQIVAETLPIVIDAAPTLVFDNPDPDTIVVNPLAQPSDSHKPHTVSEILARLLEKQASLRYVDAYEVLSDLVSAVGRSFPEESRAIRESFLQAAAFVGRAIELSQLENALNAVLEPETPQGSLWLVSGESGVGKTRLLDELRTRALVQGVAVLPGQAVEGLGAPFQLWREPVRRLLLNTQVDDLDASILSDIVPDIVTLLQREVPPAPPVEDSDYNQRMIGTITSLFQRQSRPMLLLLEDLQWSLRSLDVLKVLGGIVNRLPLLIVASFRSDERPNLLDELPGAHLLRLERLGHQQIVELSESMLGPVARQASVQQLLVRETEGNVFFLVEVVRALAEEAGRLEDIGRLSLPQTVIAGGIAQLVHRRLQRVSPEDLILLQLAAVYGRELDLEVLKAIVAQRIYPPLQTTDLDLWLATCANGGILEVQDSVWRFSHDKLRQGAIANIPQDERPAMHRAIALAIEAVYPGASEHYRALANHWNSAGDTDRELHYTHLAGRLAIRTGAFNQAIPLFERALALIRPAGLSTGDTWQLEASIQIQLGEAFENQGDYAQAIQHVEAGLTISRTLNNHLTTGPGLGVLGDVAWRQGDYARAVDYCQESLRTCRTANDLPGMARALNRIGVIYYEQGQYEDAARHLEQSLGLAHEADYQAMTATVTNNLGLIAFAQGDYGKAGEYFAETLAMTQRTGERRKIAIANLNLGVIAGEQRDYEVATRHFLETLRICQEIGERRGVSLALKNLGGLAEYQHDLQGAVDYYQQSLSIYQELGERQAIAATLTKLGHVRRLLGEIEQARTIYMDALRLANEIEAVPTIVETIFGLAGTIQNPHQALAWLGLATNHPAMFDNMRSDALALTEQIKSTLPQAEAEAIFEQGKTLDLDAVVNQLLSGTNY